MTTGQLASITRYTQVPQHARTSTEEQRKLVIKNTSIDFKVINIFLA